MQENGERRCGGPALEREGTSKGNRNRSGDGQNIFQEVNQSYVRRGH